MRNTLIFAGNSCPALAGQICENLGMQPADAELTQFSNVWTMQLSPPTNNHFD
jgi:ribose-phosphate pyrophosphokinase